MAIRFGLGYLFWMKNRGGKVTIENMVMTLNRVPEIKAVVDTGTDWTVVFGFVLTIVAVIAGSWVSLATYKRSLISQEKLARAVALKDSRQSWINELRETCAEYVATIGLLQVHAESKEVHSVFIAKVDAHDQSAAANMVAAWAEENRRLMLSCLSLCAKIQLLSNPDEPAFQELMVPVRFALSKASSVDGGAINACEEIVLLTQRILKTEWERAKKME